MTHVRKFLLTAVAAVSALACAAPVSSASTTVEPAGEKVAGWSSSTSLAVSPTSSFDCNTSLMYAEVPAAPANAAEEGPVDIATEGPFFAVCVVKTGGVAFPPTWGTTSKNGPWSLGAEVQLNEEMEETGTVLNLRTSPGGVVVSVPAIACTVTFFPEGDELEGTFDNATSTVEYNAVPASYDGTKCGIGTGIGTFTADYQFEGLSITP